MYKMSSMDLGHAVRQEHLMFADMIEIPHP